MPVASGRRERKTGRALLAAILPAFVVTACAQSALVSPGWIRNASSAGTKGNPRSPEAPSATARRPAATMPCLTWGLASVSTTKPGETTRRRNRGVLENNRRALVDVGGACLRRARLEARETVEAALSALRIGRVADDLRCPLRRHEDPELPHAWHDGEGRPAARLGPRRSRRPGRIPIFQDRPAPEPGGAPGPETLRTGVRIHEKPADPRHAREGLPRIARRAVRQLEVAASRRLVYVVGGGAARRKPRSSFHRHGSGTGLQTGTGAAIGEAVT